MTLKQGGMFRTLYALLHSPIDGNKIREEVVFLLHKKTRGFKNEVFIKKTKLNPCEE